MSREKDLAQVVDRPNMDRALALVEEAIRKEEDAQRKRIFGLIRDEQLDPQTALQAWMRLECLDSVRSSLSRKERQARSASERVSDVM